MTEQSIKEILINNIGLDAYNQLRKDHLAILDEGIESILNGSCIYYEREEFRKTKNCNNMQWGMPHCLA